jgi:AAA+ superfamily predicted ATPase
MMLGVPDTRTIRWAPPLTAALKAGLPLTVVGRQGAPSPLSSVVVLARSSGDSFSLAAIFLPTIERGALAMSPIGPGRVIGFDPARTVGARFPTRRRGSGVYVLTDDGAEQFVVAPGLFNQPTLSAGSWPLLLPLVGPHASARPLAAVKAELDRFCVVLEAALSGLRSPVAFELADTGLNVESALSGIAGFGRGFASRGQSARPGRVHKEEEEVDPVAFGEVGGQQEAKAQLEAVCLALQNPDAYKQWGARPPRGALLFGPPGTGKTLLARCVARESGAKFIHVRVSDITSKWYGEAEKKLQEAFDWARKDAPAVLFFDEIDALARPRDDAHEATHRLVSTFLENMDGLDRAAGVVVLAATNRPEAVDPAILRPGRFDRLVEVPLPDRDGRRQIFEVHIRKAERRAGRPVVEAIDEGGWERLLDATAGHSGADIAEAVRRALEAKVRAGASQGQVSQDELLAHAMTLARPF